MESSPLFGRQRRVLPRQSQSLRGAAARLLRHASSRRMMLREPSVRVRETAAERLEERQNQWVYSKAVIILDVLWNLAFVIISIAVLGFSSDENPNVPLRLWIVWYNLRCLFAVGCTIAQCRRRLEGNYPIEDSAPGPNYGSFSGSDEEGSVDYGTDDARSDDETCVSNHLESANTVFSFVWWIIGFYWVTADADFLSEHSPKLYWLCITFLAFDVIFVVICIAIAFLIGIAVCCCLPCIIAILYAIADREGGATKEEIERMPKFRFRRTRSSEKADGEVREINGGIMTELNVDSPAEFTLSNEDAECCICLSAYEDGSELREISCRHHFHIGCIDKWLRINATCPLCKFNIIKTEDHGCSEEV